MRFSGAAVFGSTSIHQRASDPRLSALLVPQPRGGRHSSRVRSHSADVVDPPPGKRPPSMCHPSRRHMLTILIPSSSRPTCAMWHTSIFDARSQSGRSGAGAASIIPGAICDRCRSDFRASSFASLSARIQPVQPCIRAAGRLTPRFHFCLTEFGDSDDLRLGRQTHETNSGGETGPCDVHRPRRAPRHRRLVLRGLITGRLP